MKFLSVLLCIVFLVSCAPTDDISGNKVSSIDADTSEIGDEIVVIDSFYPENESNVEDKGRIEKDLTSLLPLGTTSNTEHFSFSTDLSYDFTKTWAQYIDSAFSQLSQILEPRIVEKSTIFVFRNRERYKDYAKLLAPENINSRGYYDPKYRLIVSYYEDNPEKLKRTLLHECTHVMLRNYVGHNCIPPWLDEGLACTYETGNFVNGRWEFGLPRMNFVRYLIRLMKNKNFNPFRQIMSTGWRRFIAGSKEQVAMNYVISWSLVYYFLYYKNGLHRKLFVNFLHKIRETQEPEMSYAFVYENYIKPNEKEFLRTWQEFYYSLN